MAYERLNDFISEKFINNCIVPDIIPEAPTFLLEIQYENGIRVDLGKELTPTQVKNAPLHISWPAEHDAYYTLIMTFPDRISRGDPVTTALLEQLGFNREVQHWFVGNIPGNDIGKGDVLTEYVGSCPSRSQGLQRYVFLVYKQPKGLIQFRENPISNTNYAARTKSYVKAVASRYHLDRPVAGNFYQARYDEYVPTVQKQLGVVSKHSNEVHHQSTVTHRTKKRHSLW